MGDDKKSGAGALLGGLAALIAAIAALYSAMHKADPVLPSKPDPVVVTQSNLQSVAPPQSFHSVPDKHLPALRTRPPAPSPQVQSLIQPTTVPTSQASPVPFNIEGIWSGRPEGWEDHGFELHLSSEPSQADGWLALTGLIVMKCPGILESHQLTQPGINSYWRTSANQGVAVSAHSDTEAEDNLTFIFKRQGDLLVGTYYQSHPNGRGSRFYGPTLPIELRKQRLSCSSSSK